MGPTARMVAVVVLAASTSALAQRPPSPELEAAVDRYKDGDYAAAAIGAAAVIGQPAANSPRNLQLAELYLAKALFRLEIYTAAQVFFDRILVAGPGHHYHAAVLKWYVGLARVLPVAEVGDKLALMAPQINQPLNVSVRDEYRGIQVRHHLDRGEIEAAAKLVAAMPASAAETARAQLALAEFHDRRGDRDRAAAAAQAALAGALESEHHGRAQLALGRATGDDAAFAAAFAGDPKLRKTAVVGGALRKTALARHDRNLVPVLHALICGGDEVDPVLTRAGVDLAQIRRVADNAERYEALHRNRGSLAAEVLRRSLAAEVALLASLDAQIQIVETTDGGWRGSQLATEVLQELILRKALAEADTGKLALERIARVVDGLRAIEVNRAALASADKSGCSERKQPRPTAADPTPAPQPQPPPQPPPRSGCAGCASGGPGGAAILVLVALGAVRRRSH